MACRVRLDDTTTFHRLMQIGNAGSGDANHSMFLLQTAPSGTIQAYASKGGSPIVASSASTTTAFSANTWIHAAAVFESATSRTAYLNGGGGATDATSVTPGTVDSTSIGRMRWPTGSTNFFSDGNFAECAIWNVALTVAELVGLSRGLTPLQVRPQSLMAYWPLGGRYGQYDVDRWNGGYDMTAFNSPTWADHMNVIYPQPVMPHCKAATGGGATPWLYARRRSQIIGAGGVH